MSFSFTAAGTPKEVIAEVGQQAATLEQMPNGFGDSINDQLGRLPENAEVTLSCYGHTGWHDGQTAGQIMMHATIDARLTQPAPFEGVADAGDQPGAERFPEGFSEDAPPGPGAADTGPA